MERNFYLIELLIWEKNVTISNSEIKNVSQYAVGNVNDFKY